MQAMWTTNEPQSDRVIKGNSCFLANNKIYKGNTSITTKSMENGKHFCYWSSLKAWNFSEKKKAFRLSPHWGQIRVDKYVKDRQKSRINRNIYSKRTRTEEKPIKRNPQHSPPLTVWAIASGSHRHADVKSQIPSEAHIHTYKYKCIYKIYKIYSKVKCISTSAKRWQ